MSDRHAIPPYSLRMPQELRDRLESVAKGNHRSLNAEIIARLEESLAEPERPSLTTGIRRDALSGEWDRQEISGDAKHELSDQQLWDVITAVLNSVTGHDGRATPPTKGPSPRSKYPRKR